jgi:glycosyltransferase involved in cell wall biosynthesis
MKIALVHDYLNEAGGAERVLRVLSDMYPTAPIYTAFVKDGTARAMFSDHEIHESSYGWLLKIGRLFSYLRFLLPWIWRSIDLSSYDLVITSTSGGYIARGFRVGEKTIVVAYCHTPPKWLYGYETPTGAMSKWWGRMFLYVFGPPLRYFDYMSAQRVNTWIANSHEVAGRIKKFYRKDAVVVYPPIELKGNSIKVQAKRENYYLLVARITGAKGVTEAIEAAERGGFRLKLVGEMVSPKLKVKSSKYVEYLGRVDDAELVELYSRAKGFIALARDEDFGMTVVEAMGYGTPVLALNSGGYRETVVPKSGILIEDTSVESVVAGIKLMEQTKWDHSEIVKWASQFGRKIFEAKIREII